MHIAIRDSLAEVGHIGNIKIWAGHPFQCCFMSTGSLWWAAWVSRSPRVWVLNHAFWQF